jgi:predicted nucleic acid-binding protein
LLVLLDTTVLTNFARVGLTHVMIDLWGDQVCATGDALREYKRGTSAAALPQFAWRQLSILTLTPEEENMAAARFKRLGLGERSCLAVANNRGCIIATDDKPARRAAQRYGIQLMGTIGILRTCVKHRLVSDREAQTVLEKMMAAGYYSPVVKLDVD